MESKASSQIQNSNIRLAGYVIQVRPYETLFGHSAIVGNTKLFIFVQKNQNQLV